MIKPEQWSQIVELFHAAREKTHEQRAELLESVCAGQPELRQAVEQMLRSDDVGDSFLNESPAHAFAGIPPSVDPSLRPKFGRYELIAPLGHGGMGEVWEAHDTELDRRVALKFLAAIAAYEPAGERLTREARAASALNHPNIVTVHEIVHDEEMPVLVMELVEGSSVRTLVKTPQPVDRVIRMGEQISQALSAAHAHGIVHGDIKPENIMVRDDGYVKVLDFGLASRISPDSASSDGVLAGTLRYMSPEQGRGEPISPASDIFSFGIVLYELLTGVHPFPAESPVEAAHAIQAKEPLPPSSVNPLVPVKLDCLLLAMLAKEEPSRPSAADVERALRKLEAGPATDAARPSAVRLLAKHKGIAVVAAIIIAGVVYAVYRVAQRPAMRRSLDEMQITQLTHTGTVRAAALSPDGRYVAYAGDDSGAQALWLEQLATGDTVRILTPSRQEYKAMTFSHDGRYIYYVAYPSADAARLNLYRVPVAGGQASEVIAGVNSPIGLSPDGKRVALFRSEPSTGRTELVAEKLDGSGEKTLALSKPPNFFGNGSAPPAWSPDGKFIAAADQHPFRGAPATIHIVTEDGRLKSILRTPFRRIGSLAWRTDGRGFLALAEERWGTRLQPWELSYPDGQARRITNDLSDYSQLSLASDSSALVAVQQTNVSNIWVAPQGDSSRAHQITFGTGTGGSDRFDDGLTWMPDGKIVYSSRPDGWPQIWQVNPDGTGLHRFHRGKLDASELTACGNGGMLVFQSWRSGGADIWKWGPNDGDPQQLTNSGGAGTPDCSADGKWMAFISWLVGPQVLWKLPISGGKPIQLTDYQSRVPAISPDGKWIAFIDESQHPKFKIALVTPSGGKPVKTFSFVAGARVYRYLRWSPDGRDIDYNDARNGVSNIWAQPISGGPPRQVTHFQSGHIFNFAWSKAGDLALARGSSTSDAVLIKNF